MDYAKGIGIVVVVFVHIWRGLHGANLLKDIPEATFWAISSSCTILSIPTFFFASGLLFGKNLEKRHGAKEFSGKVDAIFYPYLIWSLIIGTFEVLTTGVRNGASSFSELPSIAWYPKGIFWLLYSLILSFGLTELIVLLGGVKWGRRLTLPAALMLLWLYPSIQTNVFCLPAFALSYLYFSLGLLIAKRIPERQFRFRSAIFWLGALAAAQYAFHGLLGEKTFSIQSVTPNATLFALLSIFLLFGLAYCLPQKGWTWLANLGERSIDIYLMHLLFIAALRIVFQKILGIENIVAYTVPGLIVGLYGPLAMADLLRRLNLNFLFTPPTLLSLKARLTKAA